ncbi:MAG TPA: hypothetical protein DCQ30_02110 [Acidimicrobiaceae bacterium]|nr:hypothetical protein [Acidimicrobiaceae bacterium]
MDCGRGLVALIAPQCWPNGDRRLPLLAAMGLTLVAGAIGWGADRAAVDTGSYFPSTGYLLGEVGWKLATIGIMVWGLKKFEGRSLDLRATGFASDASASRPAFPVALFVVVLLASVTLWLTVGSSATTGSVYGTVHRAGLGLLLAEVLVRYPLTAFAEESFFRGWLQPRLGPSGPVLSAVLWGIYHLQQVSSIPSLIVFGLGLGALRWWLGNVRLTAAFHYASDVTFFVVTYR